MLLSGFAGFLGDLAGLKLSLERRHSTNVRSWHLGSQIHFILHDKNSLHCACTPNRADHSLNDYVEAARAFAQQSDSASLESEKELRAGPKPSGGVIKRDTCDSEPRWDPRITPSKGAPNVLLILTDDAGSVYLARFGGAIATPALGRIANNALRYTNFNSTALCSPTRAASITVRNHHSMGHGLALAAGKHTVEFDFKYEGLGIGTLVFGRPAATRALVLIL